jgi:hypothetical protein
MNECPKCGGATGFKYDWVLRTHRWGQWGKNQDEESTADLVQEVKTVTCIDCGARIKWDAAHGEVTK